MGIGVAIDLRVTDVTAVPCQERRNRRQNSGAVGRSETQRELVYDHGNPIIRDA